MEFHFGDIMYYSRFADLKNNLEIWLSAVGKIYTVSALLRNAMACLHENSTSTFFDINPPTINNYSAVS